MGCRKRPDKNVGADLWFGPYAEAELAFQYLPPYGQLEPKSLQVSECHTLYSLSWAIVSKCLRMYLSAEFTLRSLQ
jgi:hypothetical protein